MNEVRQKRSREDDQREAMSIEDYRIKLDNLKKEVSVASNYFLLSELVKEYQELSEQLLRDYSNHEFFLRIEKENKDNLKIANKENN